MTKISAWLAMAFGLSLAVLEAVRNWGNWQWWPFWMVDYVAAGLLVAGGVLTLRRGVDRWLTSGWASPAPCSGCRSSDIWRVSSPAGSMRVKSS